jgi:hypothetical protein
MTPGMLDAQAGVEEGEAGRALRGVGACDEYGCAYDQEGDPDSVRH